MQIKDDPSLKWPEKMKGDPNKHNRSKYCHFHRDHGHDTNECFDLKQQVENLIRQGKLKSFLGRDHKDEKLKGKVEESSRPPLEEIRIIIGGNSTGQTSKSKKSLLESCAERPTFWTVSKGNTHGRAVNYFHGRRCRETSPSS